MVGINRVCYNLTRMFFDYSLIYHTFFKVVSNFDRLSKHKFFICSLRLCTRLEYFQKRFILTLYRFTRRFFFTFF